MDRQVIYIELRYSDGTKEAAEGDAAGKIWAWLTACQTMACIHGAVYAEPWLEKKE